LGENNDLDVLFLQSNHEGQIVTWIQEAINKVDAIVLNAGAYTHTSIAIHDALRAYNGFVIELHISNPHLRESFRHLSYVSSAANAVIAGLGVQGYERSIEIIAQLRDQTTLLESH
jgi:3-dehydroquinate dehydratase-2